MVDARPINAAILARTMTVALKMDVASPAPGMDEVREALLAFVSRSFMVAAGEIDQHRSLIDQGVIDSFGLVEITAFLAERFGVEVREEDMTRERFGSLERMARFVVGRRAEPA